MSAACETLLDAHVHYHPCFSKAEFFSAAVRNFDIGAAQLGLDGPRLGGLMFTESSGDHAFEAMRREARPTPPPDAGPNHWWFRPAGEDTALWAVQGPEERTSLLLIAGRQMVTSEGLEVLALGGTATLPDGMELTATIGAVLAEGAIPVVPWGFGKWWSRRGRLVEQLLVTDVGGQLFLGDNAGRPGAFPRPRLFERAIARDIYVLPGSDPLPFPRQVGKAGRCGFLLGTGLEIDRPATSVIESLHRCRQQPETFGAYENLGNFAVDQLAMQIRKRRSGATATSRRDGGAT
jgi:hypothetical protein